MAAAVGQTQPSDVAAVASAMRALCRTATALCNVQRAEIHLDPRAFVECSFEAGAAWNAFAPSFPHPIGLSEPLVAEDAASGDVLSGRTGFFASVPLRTSPTSAKGVLCVMDPTPRRFGESELEKLKDLAAIAATQAGLHLRIARASRQQALFKLLADNTTDLVVRGELDGSRVYLSPAVQSILGYEPAELFGTKAGDYVHPEDVEEFRELMAKVKAGDVELGVTEHRHRRKDGSWTWVEGIVRLTRDATTSAPDGYVACIRDISRRKEAETRLAYTATHDALTGLPNRELLQECLAAELARCKRTGAAFAVHWLDLDRFKAVNDHHGHDMGDVVLRATAERFRSVLRTEDTVARLGGDEFVVIQTNVADAPASAIQLADRLIQAANRPIDAGGKALQVGLSVGIAMGPHEGASAQGLLKAADDALYAAKAAGRNRWCVYERATAC